MSLHSKEREQHLRYWLAEVASASSELQNVATDASIFLNQKTLEEVSKTALALSNLVSEVLSPALYHLTNQPRFWMNQDASAEFNRKLDEIEKGA